MKLIIHPVHNPAGVSESEDDNYILSGVLQFGSRGCFDGFNYCPTAVLLGCLLFYGMYYVHGI